MTMKLEEFLAHQGLNVIKAPKLKMTPAQFIAHYGVKGMKWGVRRSQPTLDRSAGRKSSTVTVHTADGKVHPINGHSLSSAMKSDPPGSLRQFKMADGSQGLLLKHNDGTWHETHLSESAFHMLKTSQLGAHQLTDKEINDALTRARITEQYNAMFGPKKADNPLKAQVEQLQLEKQYAQLHSELHPSRSAKAKNFVNSSADAYIRYKKIDKASGGALSKSLSKAMADMGVATKRR